MLFLTDKTFVATINLTMTIWDVPSGTLERVMDSSILKSESTDFKGAISDVALMPNGSMAVLFGDGSVEFWDISR
jgi:prepilin-type processing-associated H-X9-DG protein